MLIISDGKMFHHEYVKFLSLLTSSCCFSQIPLGLPGTEILIPSS